ncbi:protein of unknown function [Taphrina deformans PYCC 5710]|uniref:Multiple myeloma tumor-associated protein 2-like N-terminal domain-containing protein n=1 Tax=Taphrina deformans (strain PYCC 5710 / ATCC 11124 / CBS 356.35 / IMI 108563 / JCM 9778 / NBRC 8474) TaxID=1097556 RepID=R4XGL0_TAPDE|nr:protein of unknown function [Taphrina deformans PYCC 5710]|eukprot:CCG84926.1 protein of unknown function [Taphrina deformans PYCC 5710]
MSEGPTRLTVRGGRDQFDWNNVKDDKHYQNYLGHSLKAPVGRWQHNKDLEWFNKAGESEESKNSARLEELRVLKQAEEEALAAAMGITLPPREQRQGHAEVPSKTDEKSDDAQEQRSRRRQARRSNEADHVVENGILDVVIVPIVGISRTETHIAGLTIVDEITVGNVTHEMEGISEVTDDLCDTSNDIGMTVLTLL